MENELKKDVLFSSLTTLGIGGPISYFVTVNNVSRLVYWLKFAKENGLPYLVIGGGSNLFVSDNGFNGLVIKNEIAGIKQEGSSLTVQSGTLLQDLVNYTIEHGLGSMNKLTDIPGTVGGAIYGKAGAYGHNISDYLKSVVALNPETLKQVKLSKEDCKFGYRDSLFKKNKFLILTLKFSNLPADDTERMKLESEEIMQKRHTKYPQNTKCPGSFFKNVIADQLPNEILKNVKQYLTPYGKIPAGSLIEAVGGKGDQLGNIKIAENHANTFVNLGGGTSGDFYDLVTKYQRLVNEKFGILLEPEVQFIGFGKEKFSQNYESVSY